MKKPHRYAGLKLRTVAFFEPIFFKPGWITVQNPHRFIDELIEIGEFVKILNRNND